MVLNSKNISKGSGELPLDAMKIKDSTCPQSQQAA